MKKLTSPCVLAIGTIVASSTAWSQSVLYSLDGNSPNARLGQSVSGGGDVNGDNIPDLIVGIPFDDTNGNEAGKVSVFSGSDGSILHSFLGDGPDDAFGSSVSNAGDVNGDGFADLVVGGPGPAYSPQGGMARVLSGVDGSPLFTVWGNPGDNLGHSVSGAGDVNGDGFDDVIVGADQAYSTPWSPQPGYAEVRSGPNGTLLYRLRGDLRGDRFGYSVSGAGDVNGDGFDDLVVGAPFNYMVGSPPFDADYVRVFSGVDGSTLFTLFGDSISDRFGFSVSDAGDVDGDGLGDIIIGDVTTGMASHPPGKAWVYSGTSVLYSFVGSSTPLTAVAFGFSVSGAGDINRDGFDDFIISSMYDDSIEVHSGIDGSVFYELTGGARFGTSVSGAGDVDGDGFPDLIVGTPGDNGNAGSAQVFSGRDAIGLAYCSPAVPNSSGYSAMIQSHGSAFAASNDMTLLASRVPQNSFGYFLGSRTQDYLGQPGGSQGVMCVGGSVGRFDMLVQNSGASNAISIQVDLAGIPQPIGSVAVQVGETWNFQAWYRDANPGATSNFTDAVSVTFQ